jgi:hypothetical protein
MNNGWRYAYANEFVVLVEGLYTFRLDASATGGKMNPRRHVLYGNNFGWTGVWEFNPEGMTLLLNACATWEELFCPRISMIPRGRRAVPIFSPLSKNSYVRIFVVRMFVSTIHLFTIVHHKNCRILAIAFCVTNCTAIFTNRIRCRTDVAYCLVHIAFWVWRWSDGRTQQELSLLFLTVANSLQLPQSPSTPQPYPHLGLIPDAVSNGWNTFKINAIYFNCRIYSTK